MFTKNFPMIVHSGCFHTWLEMETTQMSISWWMDKHIMISQEMDINNIKEQTTDTYNIFTSQIMLKKAANHQRLCTGLILFT